MRIVFAGSPESALPVLTHLVASPHEVLAVLSRPDAPRGRGRKVAASPVAACAAQNLLPLYQPPKLKQNAEAQSYLRRLEPDLGVVVAYGALLPPEILEIPRYGWINVHFSLLPRWRGAAPVQRALQAGDTTTGITIFRLEEALDTGPVYATRTFEIPPTCTAGQMLDILAQASVDPLDEALDIIERGIKPTAQSNTGVTYAKPLNTSEGEVDWNQPAAEIVNHVRGFTPAPGAWTIFEETRLKLGVPQLETETELPAVNLSPGELFTTRHQVWVGTGTVPLCLGTVGPAGRKHMTAEAWARGVTLESGMRLGEAPN